MWYDSNNGSRGCSGSTWFIALVMATFVGAGVSTGQESSNLVIDAVRSRDAAVLTTLITSGADVNTPQGDGSTALHWAAYWEDTESVEALIDAGADVNIANELGMTPLHMTCTSGNADLVEALLVAGANPNTTLASGETALMAASRAGSVEGVESLLRRGANVNVVEHTRGQSALMWATANTHSAVVKVLLEAGADVHARSQVRHRVYNMGGSRSAGSASQGIPLREVAVGGSTPLLFAARSGDVESARLLLQAGADVNDTAGDGNNVLVIAAHSGHGTLAAFLLDSGADPNAAPLGYSSLHAAVLRGDLRDRGVRNTDLGSGLTLVRTLLAHGADPNAQVTRPTPVRRWSHDFALMDRWNGATPFWLAAKFLEFDMMTTLADAGADIRMASRDGTTPLMAAAGLGYRRGGGSAFITDRRDFSSYNPVASAELGSKIPESEEQRAVEAVELIMELGGDVTATTASGDTALHAAATHGMDSMVELLVARGADLSVENERGQTPMAMAVYREGIAGESLIRTSTVGLLRELDPSRHLTEPHRHPEAQAVTNPVASDSDSIAAGANSYGKFCAACHGEFGSGDGRLAAGVSAYGVKPSNLADSTWQHGSSEGEIFAVIRDGIGPDFSMDAFNGPLSEVDIWNLVNYVQSLGGL